MDTIGQDLSPSGRSPGISFGTATTIEDPPPKHVFRTALSVRLVVVSSCIEAASSPSSLPDPLPIPTAMQTPVGFRHQLVPES